MILANNSDELAIDLVSLRNLFPGQTAAGERWLSRPFSRTKLRRVLLIYVDNPLALPQYRAFLRYRERFRRVAIEFRAIPFHLIDRQSLPSNIAAVFLQAPYESDPRRLEGVLETLRETYPDAPISFFDWAAPTDIRFATTTAPYVSTYLKKALLRDVDAYRVATAGHTQLVDYFSARHGLPIDPPHWPVEPAMIDRLVAGPSFFTSRTLMPVFEQMRPLATERPIDCHARIAVGGVPWYAAMRQEAKQAISRNLEDLNVVSDGKVSQSRFLAELSKSKLCFSPFGYGELCWRDFEAVLTGAVLVKQDMSHILTAPDIFRDRETYFAVRWDLSDLEETIREALSQPERLRIMADNARSMITHYLAGPALEHLVERLISAQPRSAHQA